MKSRSHIITIINDNVVELYPEDFGLDGEFTIHDIFNRNGDVRSVIRNDVEYYLDGSRK